MGKIPAWKVSVAGGKGFGGDIKAKKPDKADTATISGGASEDKGKKDGRTNTKNASTQATVTLAAVATALATKLAKEVGQTDYKDQLIRSVAHAAITFASSITDCWIGATPGGTLLHQCLCRRHVTASI